MNVNFTKTAVRFFTLAAIAAFGIVAGFAQTENRVGPVKGAVIKGGQNPHMTFCVQSSEPLAGTYRLKVWQLMQGQTPEAAIAANKIIVTANYHAINTKGAGANDRTTPSADETACNEALATPEPAANTAQRGRTKINNLNERLAVVVVEGVMPCAKGTSCDYIWTVEEVAADGTTIKLVTSVQNPYRFSIAPDGTIKPLTSERTRVEVLKSN